MVYRITLKVGWHEAHFEFETIEEAGEFAKQVITHSVNSDDTEKTTDVSIKVVDKELEAAKKAAEEAAKAAEEAETKKDA